MSKREDKKTILKKGSTKEVGELRQDLVTGKWVVVATGRAKRPHDFSSERQRPKRSPRFDDDCPFCRLDRFPQEADVVRLPDSDDWQVHIFPNKYPAFSSDDEFRSWQVGPYRAMESVGFHEVLATRWHDQLDPYLKISELSLQLEALVLRYRQLREKSAVNYIQIIKNHGKEAGGSLAHPHHQIFTVPVLPSDVGDLLLATQKYAKEEGRSPFDAILEFELETKERIVYENEKFVAWCPYASRIPFEVQIMPKKAEPYFENIGPEERDELADALRTVLTKIYLGLNDPPLNYYINSAPCDESGFVCDTSTFANFRWHISVMPRMNVWGGFELGTGLEITTALPEESARYLKEQDVSEIEQLNTYSSSSI